MLLKKPADVYQYIIHFIFAIVIATSYDYAVKVFLNPEKEFFSDFSSLIPCLELLLAYVSIVSGWVGYTRSMLKWPHTHTKAGAFRFSLDLAILFCYFGLVSSTALDKFEQHFMSWVIVLFGLFAVWDAVKIIEYRKNKGKTVALSKSFWKTIVFLIFFAFIIPAIHSSLLKNQFGIVNDHTIYGGLLLFVTFLMLLYRYWKWSIPPEPRSIKDATTKNIRKTDNENSQAK